MYTKNFQMYKLCLDKAKEPETQLPTSVASQKNQENSRRTSVSSSLTTLKTLILWITINWKILKEMGIPDHLTCLLIYLCVCQKSTVRTGHGTTDWFKLGKHDKAAYCHPVYLTYMQRKPWEMLDCMSHRVESRLLLFSHLVISDSLRPHASPVLRHPLKFAQNHVHWVGDAIQSFYPLSFPSPPAFILSQHHGHFQSVYSLQQGAKILELQLQYQLFQWIFRVDFL